MATACKVMDPRMREDDAGRGMDPRMREDDAGRAMDPRMREDDGKCAVIPAHSRHSCPFTSFLRRQESIPVFIPNR